MNKKITIFIISMIIFAGCCSGCKKIGKRTPRFQDFILTEDSWENVSHWLLYRNNQNRIRLKIITGLDNDSAQKIRDNSIMMIQSIYDSSFSPYPGAISNEIVCDPKFIPQLVSVDYRGLVIKYFIVYLSERLTYGVCVDDLARYRAVIAWAYCQTQSELRQLEFIAPKDAGPEANQEFVIHNICN